VIREPSDRQGARGACRLQKLVDASSRCGEREPQARDAVSGQPDVAAPFRQKGADSRWVNGCEAGASERQRERGPACFDREIEDRANGRRPGADGLHGPKPTVAIPVPGRAGSPFAMKVAKGAARAGSAPRGARSFAPVLRQRASEVCSSGEASSADGRRRSAAAAVAPRCRSHAAPAKADQSSHG
jgi:hypothetical protein